MIVEQDSIMEIEEDDPSEEMIENHDEDIFGKDENKRIGESPVKDEINGEKFPANQEDNKEKAESPTENEDNKKSGSPTKRKRLVKGKGKVTKKSPVTNSLTTTKAVKQDAEREVKNPDVEIFESNEGVKFAKDKDKKNIESPSEHEDNGEKVESAAYQEDNEKEVKFSSEKEDIMKKSGSHIETTNNAESSKRKRLVKGKGKVTKKSPVTNIKAVEQDAEKEEKNPTMKMQGNVVEKFKKDEDKRNEKSLSEHKDDGEKVQTAANQEHNQAKVKSPTEKEDTKICNLAESSKRKILVKGKGKITKKSPATNFLNTIKAIEQDAKLEVENPTVEILESNEGDKFTKDKGMRNGKSPLKDEDNGEKVDSAADQEENKEKVKSPSEREQSMKKFGGHTETYNKAESSKLKRQLMAKGKIMKKTPMISSLSAIKAEGSPMVQGKQRLIKGRKKTPTQGKIKSRSIEEKAINVSCRDDKKKTNSEEQSIQDSKGDHTDIEMMAKLQKGPEEVKIEKKSGTSDARKEKRKEKVGDEEKSELNKNKKEKLGGLIFMCSAKTKPDCFRYKIMGVSIGKKDIVLAIKPGLKLFLYDFDLKLLYGVYRASSNGGMKLEPKAFGGAFPAQVRFKVHKECFPLPETVFKKAIKENYYAKNKFKTELTFKQVKELTELYRSAESGSSHSSKRRIHTPPRIRGRREVHARSRDLEYEDSFANGDSRSYPFLHRERDREIVRRELSPIRREEIPRDLYLSEKDYRSFGLRGERRNLASSSRGSYETLPRDYDTEPIPRHPEYRRIDPLYLEEKEHLAYSLRYNPATSSFSLGVRSPYTNDPYLVPRLDVPPLDPYLPPPQREVAELAYSREGRSYMMEGSRRIDIGPVDRLYSTYASEPLSQSHDFCMARPEKSTMPVSSRSSFAGPSFSYR